MKKSPPEPARRVERLADTDVDRDQVALVREAELAALEKRVERLETRLSDQLIDAGKMLNDQNELIVRLRARLAEADNVLRWREEEWRKTEAEYERVVRALRDSSDDEVVDLFDRFERGLVREILVRRGIYGEPGELAASGLMQWLRGRTDHATVTGFRRSSKSVRRQIDDLYPEEGSP